MRTDTFRVTFSYLPLYRGLFFPEMILSRKYANQEVCRPGSMLSRKYADREVCWPGSLLSRKYAVQEVCWPGSMLSRKYADWEACCPGSMLSRKYAVQEIVTHHQISKRTMLTEHCLRWTLALPETKLKHGREQTGKMSWNRQVSQPLQCRRIFNPAQTPVWMEFGIIFTKFCKWFVLNVYFPRVS